MCLLGREKERRSAHQRKICMNIYILCLCISFANEPYKRDYILHKRPMILRSLLMVDTPQGTDMSATIVELHLHIYKYICINTRKYIHVNTLHICRFERKICMYIYILCLCIYICIYVYICMYIHTCTHREGDLRRREERGEQVWMPSFLPENKRRKLQRNARKYCSHIMPFHMFINPCNMTNSLETPLIRNTRLNR